MLNKATINIMGKDRVMIATFANLSAIEEDLGMGLISLVEKAINAQLTHKQLLAVIYNSLNGSVDRLEKSQIQKEIETHGYVKFYAAVSEFLTIALRGGEEKKELPEVQPA